MICGLKIIILQVSHGVNQNEKTGFAAKHRMMGVKSLNCIGADKEPGNARERRWTDDAVGRAASGAVVEHPAIVFRITFADFFQYGHRAN